jgi:integrase
LDFLRHTFAVHALEQMVEQGWDLYTALPMLSTYLGHRTLAATERYVRLTATAHASVTQALAPLYDNLYPEVSDHGE